MRDKTVNKKQLCDSISAEMEDSPFRILSSSLFEYKTSKRQILDLKFQVLNIEYIIRSLKLQIRVI